MVKRLAVAVSIVAAIALGCGVVFVLWVQHSLALADLAQANELGGEYALARRALDQTLAAGLFTAAGALLSFWAFYLIRKLTR